MTKRMLISITLALALLGAPLAAWASEGGGLMTAQVNVRDTASVQRGARLFFNYCVGCHSLHYMRYARIGKDLGLTEKQVMDNLNFTGAKFGDTVQSSMPSADAQKWFGKAPPDLSLEVRAKGEDWVYSYLNSFYLDPSRPVGWNNTVFPNASMPNVLWELQGIQVPVLGHEKGEDKPVVERLRMDKAGQMSPAQYHAATRDLTAFLTYVSEPAALKRHSLGVWVILYLALFTFLAFMLKREYWKDVH
ncbi:cytochrome c1 [Oleiagrimonas sp. C23AA]|uniref:cytochrome c1 n=1 Tax=Oleiagrimonas sp. C23AA TaxID=2719047 RepID=UPI00142382BC|nr:cytochrome c1 [Oleiagrimonas sp. C23AA]NII11470.1 cytochrome c1 [Oleiagrimonas sp. C23AA]